MNLLLYFAVGLVEWFLALTRTLACLRNRPVVVCISVLIENLVGLLVLRNFVLAGDWMIAVAYSTGGAIGSILPHLLDKWRSK